MSARVFFASVLILGIGEACSRKHEAVMENVREATPEPAIAKAVEPPKPEPIKLGEPPRLREETR